MAAYPEDRDVQKWTKGLWPDGSVYLVTRTEVVSNVSTVRGHPSGLIGKAYIFRINFIFNKHELANTSAVFPSLLKVYKAQGLRGRTS